MWDSKEVAFGNEKKAEVRFQELWDRTASFPEYGWFEPLVASSV